ncbi:2-hydroxyacyl-CoA dehydratase, partial [bacterium]|nr:2-hydroxyacyl-CoA dehydratase [bacterium]
MKASRSVDKILNNLAEIVEQPYEKAKGWKRSTGSKVIGVFPMHFPEELIHAAGVLPIVFQESDQPVTLGHAY